MMWVTFHYPYAFCCQLVLYSSHVPRPKMIIASLARWNQKSKGVAYPLRADEKFVILNLSHHFVPMHPSHSWFWNGSDWIDAKSALRLICCLNICLNFCGGWWILYRQLIPHRAYFALLCRMKSVKIRWNTWRCRSTLSARMRQQPENLDHLRCSPIKAIC